MEIPLKNKNGEIIAHAIVSEEDYEHLSQFKWFKNNNYVNSEINNKVWNLHRYIMIQILGNELISKNLIDHINNKPLDNTRENLRIVTHSENARNRKKKKNTTSQYFNVSKKDEKWWKTYIRINDKSISAYYINEIHAAHQYNLWVKEYDLKTAKINEIEEPHDFVPWVARKKKDSDLPTGIVRYNGDKFMVKINIEKKQIVIGIYDNLEEAILIRKNEEKKLLEYNINKLNNTPILYNQNNDCIFKINEIEVIIDEDLYYDIIKYTWRKISNGYIQGYIHGKIYKLHRYVMNYSGDNYIDHINGNKLDNRKINLLIATPQQNSMNRTSHINSYSPFLGVSKKGNTFFSMIKIKGKTINLGYFDNEIEAAKARDIASKEHFGEFAKLNFPDEI
jgi:hypothetical protein